MKARLHIAFSRSTLRNNTTMHNPNFEILCVSIIKVPQKMNCRTFEIVSPCAKATIERYSDEVFSS